MRSSVRIAVSLGASSRRAHTSPALDAPTRYSTSMICRSRRLRPAGEGGAGARRRGDIYPPNYWRYGFGQARYPSRVTNDTGETLLFVYGTLRRGGPNDAQIE